MEATIDAVKAHYGGPDRSDVVGRVREMLATMGPGRIEPERLVAFDHFHVRGAEATAELAKLVGVQSNWTVLDAGSGLGGPSRYLAEHFGCQVEGVDLTPAFVEIAELLADRAGLAGRLKYTVGDITALPFEAAQFDLVWCEHVAMNIADRAGLYREFRRVLKVGGLLAFYDVVAIDGPTEPRYPLPWSETAATSFLRTHAATLDAIKTAGFTIEAEHEATAGALEWFQRVLGTAKPGPSLSLVMGPRMAAMAPNLAQSVRERSLGLLMGVARAV